MRYRISNWQARVIQVCIILLAPKMSDFAEWDNFLQDMTDICNKYNILCVIVTKRNIVKITMDFGKFLARDISNAM